MITNLILNIFYVGLQLVLSPILLLPNVSLDPSILESLKKAQAYFYTFNFFAPVDTVLICFTIVLGIEIVIGTYKIVMWVIRRIPGQG